MDNVRDDAKDNPLIEAAPCPAQAIVHLTTEGSRHTEKVMALQNAGRHDDQRSNPTDQRTKPCANYYVAYFFGGAFLANALPHLGNGISGHAFQSPFASPPGQGLSSSTVNVLWGLFNLAVGDKSARLPHRQIRFARPSTCSSSVPASC